MKPEITALIHYFSERYGRDISIYTESFLELCLQKRQAATFQPAPTVYLAYLLGNEQEAEIFLQSLWVTYSEFFRNPLAFSVLETLVLPHLVEEKKKYDRAQIRVWSAGCASGQEAYSIAILLDELAANNGNFTYQIFATDISQPELEAGRAGRYPAADLKNVRLKHLQTYFTQQGDSYQVNEKLRARVDFSLYDLLDTHAFSPPASIYGDFDLIFCSNVLFYYRPDLQEVILSKLYRSLLINGYLVTGETEREIVDKYAGFRPLLSPAGVHQKTTRHGRTDSIGNTKRLI